MSNIIIELYDLNNALLVPTGRIDGMDSFTITYREDEDLGIVSSSYSSELTFYDDGYQLIYNALINNPLGFNEKIKVKIYDKCCNKLVYEGFIKGDSIDWCEAKCSVTCNIIFEDESLSCIKNTVIWDNTNDVFLGPPNNRRQYNRVEYCIENRPQFIHALVMFLGIILYLVSTLILFIVFPIILQISFVLWSICNIISIFSNDAPPCGSPFEFVDTQIAPLLDLLKDNLLPCTDYHTGAYVRDYIKNACQKCGLNFKSSILNDAGGQVGSVYYNLLLLAMEVKKGRQGSSTDNSLIEDNLPVETLETLFRDYLSIMFNGKWRVVGNDFIFERKDYFDLNNEWIDANQLYSDGKILNNSICWNWIDKQRYAYGRFEYSMDAMEYVGNEAKLQYNDIVDWNTNPTSSSQTGELTKTVQSSTVRCIGDQYNEIVRFFANAASVIPGVNTTPANKMLMAQHTAFNYKFIIYSGNPERPIQTNYSDSFIGTSLNLPPVQERYNYPLWFVGPDPNTGTVYQNNLYSLFHYIDNPRLPSSVQYNFEFTFKFDCGEYDTFSFDKYVKLNRGALNLNGKVKELEVDFNKRLIKVKGVA